MLVGANKMNVPAIREKLAFIISPLMPSLYFIALVGYTHEGDGNDQNLAFIMLFSLSASYLACFCFGIPTVLFLKKRKALSVFSVVGVGAALGVIVYSLVVALLSILIESNSHILPSVSDVMWGMFFGLVVALPLGLIAGYPMTRNRS